MEPLKFEKQLKEQLSQQELNVSPEAWDRLAMQLDGHEGQKKDSRKRVYRMAAACSVGILILATTFFINSGHPDSNSPIVIQQQEKPMDAVTTTDTILKPISEQQEGDSYGTIQEVDVVQQSKQHAVVKKRIAHDQNDTKPVIAVSKNSFAAVERVPEHKNNHTSAQLPYGLIRAKTIAIIDSVSKLEHTNHIVTDAEIDVLLQQAQREIMADKSLKNNQQSISATALLRDIESELDQSFKEQVYEALKISFRKVRTALVEQ